MEYIHPTMVEKWNNMTDNNMHSERLVDMAVYYEQYDYAAMFQRFANMQNLTLTHTEERYNLFKSFICRIKQEYSEELANQLFALK